MVGFHNALRNFRTGNLDVHDAGTLIDVIEGSPHQLSDLPPPLIRVQRTHRVNQAPQVLVWGINWEDRLCNKKTKQLKQAMDLNGKQDT